MFSMIFPWNGTASLAVDVNRICTSWLKQTKSWKRVFIFYLVNWIICIFYTYDYKWLQNLKHNFWRKNDIKNNVILWNLNDSPSVEKKCNILICFHDFVKVMPAWWGSIVWLHNYFLLFSIVTFSGILRDLFVFYFRLLFPPPYMRITNYNIKVSLLII